MSAGRKPFPTPIPPTVEIRGEYASRRIWIDGVELTPGRSRRAWDHSPDGFNWGYGGSGPAQLALAICLFALPGNPDEALRLYQRFKWDFVALLPEGDFTRTWDLETMLNLCRQGLAI